MTHSPIEYVAIFEDDPRLEQVFDIAEEFFNEDNCLGNFNRVHARNSWRHVMLHCDGVVFAGVCAGKIVGVIFVAIVPDIHTGRRVATEVGWFVKPEFRKSRLGLKLFTLFEEWAISNNVDAISVTHLVDSMPEKVGKFYRSKGYSVKDLVYGKELNHGSVHIDCSRGDGCSRSRNVDQ